ncbi:HEAT repeat domain-containing protein [Amycolatopsis sp. NPDC051045]|uniref:HEAT repeat domain-containing protein n=1 Tax=Amycolatopsis sp. NPDC051045 TaxID=3156922 RepID=UPI0034444A9E
MNNALKDEDKLVRSRAAAALGRITHEKPLPLLTEALRDPRPRVRANAATAPGRTSADGLRSPRRRTGRPAPCHPIRRRGHYERPPADRPP